MKQIELKKVPMTVFGEEKEFSYKEMLQVIMETPQDTARGASIDEVRKSIRVLDALDGSIENLSLEDADYSHMMSKVNGTRFSTANKVFVAFVEDLEKAAEDVKEVS